VGARRRSSTTSSRRPRSSAASAPSIDELLVSQPDYDEQALEIADMRVRSGAIDVVAVDSITILTPRFELEEEQMVVAGE
jgi:recombination protein RecA